MYCHFFTLFLLYGGKNLEKETMFFGEEEYWRRKMRKMFGEGECFFCGGEEEWRGKIRKMHGKGKCHQLEKDGRAKKGHWRAKMSNLETVQVINGH